MFGVGFKKKNHVTYTSNLQILRNYSQIFLVSPLPPRLKTNIHFICTTNRSNIKVLGKQF